MRSSRSLAPNRKMEGSEEATVVEYSAEAPEQESATGESVARDAKELLNKSFCEEEEASGEPGSPAECGSGEVEEKDDSKVSAISVSSRAQVSFLHSPPSLSFPLSVFIPSSLSLLPLLSYLSCTLPASPSHQEVPQSATTNSIYLDDGESRNQPRPLPAKPRRLTRVSCNIH